MLKNYFKIAIRTITKQKLFSLINVLSLTIGLGCSTLIYMFVVDEISHDKFNDNLDQLHRVVQTQFNVDGSLAYNGLSHAFGMGPALVEEIPSVTEYYRFFQPWEQDTYYVKNGESTFKEEILFGDFTVFNGFSFPIVAGTTTNETTNAVVLSTSMASKLFGDTPALGKSLSVDIFREFVDFTVVAVMEDIPDNSSIKFDILLPLEYLTKISEFKEYVDSWGFGAIVTYVKTDVNFNHSRNHEPLQSLLASKYPNFASIAEQRGYATAEAYRYLHLQPLAEVHFDSKTGGLRPSSNPMYSYILAGIALGILFIGCINFMNLSIARSSNRAKEVGLRKTVGASQRQLLFQFLGESVLMAIISLAFSILLIDLALPFFNYATGKTLHISMLLEPIAILTLTGTSLVLGVVSGVYPALVLTRFKVGDAFSGKLKVGGSNLITKILVIFQFSLSAILIVGMIVMAGQINYLQNKDLGFKGDNLIQIPNVLIGNSSVYAHLKDKAEAFSGIKNITSANQSFASPSGLGGRGFEYRGKPMRLGVITVSDNYLESFGIELVAGRKFNPDLESDFDRNVILNQQGMDDFELEINDQIDGFSRDSLRLPIVVGVMGDFHYSSLRSIIMPMLITTSKSEKLDYIFAKIAPGQLESSLKFLEATWLEVAPDLPFEYSFLDDTMKAQYESDNKWNDIISVSMFIAIVLSCLGLFGIVAMTISSRKGDIGVRKVLGAQIGQIVWHYSSKYAALVAIAFVIAIPASYWGLQRWLEQFAFKIEIGLTAYLIGALLISIIAGITISVKVLEVARQNPVDSLRQE